MKNAPLVRGILFQPVCRLFTQPVWARFSLSASIERGLPQNVTNSF
jgi:hypothetical protein